jgi:selenocysteine lyase/cysteine desulfurase
MGHRTSRRGLLLGAVGMGTLAATGGDSAVGELAEPVDRPAGEVRPARQENDGDWAGVRARFELTPAVAHMDAFVLAAHPVEVREAIDRHRRALDADTMTQVHEVRPGAERRVRSAAAQYLGGSPDQVALTDSTTMGLGLLYGGLRLSAGDEVLTTEHDFYATHESLRLRSERDGVAVRRVRLYDEPEHADADQIVQRLRQAVTPRTRVVAITWVHSYTGVKLPVQAIAAALDRRVLLCVDGVHGFGVEGEPVARLGCDFLVTGCHKWLFGPRGTGLVWGTDEAWREFVPIIPTFDDPGAPGPRATPGGYHSFEHRWALAEAFDFHARIGLARVAARTRDLATALKEGLRAMPGVRVVTPTSAELSAGIVCCDVSGMPPQQAVAMLRERGVHASVTPYDEPFLRFGPSLTTLEADVEATLRAMRELA